MSEKTEKLGEDMYIECAKKLREHGAGVLISVATAVLIYVIGFLVFIPIAEAYQPTFFGYPVTQIIAFVILVALAILVLRIVYQIHELTDGFAGVLAYEFGKAGGEVTTESYKHYRTAIRGVLYVIVVAGIYLLFAGYLAKIHAGLAALFLIAIVIWAVFSLYRAGMAIGAEVKTMVEKWAEKLEKKKEKKE